MTSPKVADEHINLALKLASIAISEIGDYLADRQLEAKTDGSPVTDLDKSLELQLSKSIKRYAPDHGIIGEEYGQYHPTRDWVWILDPIDGTRQFAAGLSNYGCLIALTFQHRPVIGVIVHPPSGSICLGVEGQRTTVNGNPVQTDEISELSDAIACLSDPDAFDSRTHRGYKAVQAASRWNVYDGGCTSYVALASGKLSVTLNGPNLEPFDIAPLIPVVRGAGGSITDWVGNPLDALSSGEIVATSNADLHEAVLKVLAQSTNPVG